MCFYSTFIVFVFRFYLLAFSSNLFNISTYLFTLHIKSLVYRLRLVNKTFKILWLLSHVGIIGNKTADGLVFPTKFKINYRSFKALLVDLLQIHKKIIWNAWQFKWFSLLCLYVYRYKNILPRLWFYGISLHKCLLLSLSVDCALSITGFLAFHFI